MNEPTPNREGIITAAIHIIECELKRPDGNPSQGVIIALNALSGPDQKKVAERMIAFLKEQKVIINQKH